MDRLETVLVVGASLAGLRAVETLRRDGYDGRLVLVGAEAHLPYDRPPLSKQLLTGEWDTDRVWHRDPAKYDELAVELVLGRRATSLDATGRTVTLDDGQGVGFDGLVIATGATPRRLPGTPELTGIHTLRTLDDAVAIRDALAASPRVAVVGAGFIGSEVAAGCRHHGVEVTVLEALPVPLAHILGEEMGRACAALHADHGVTVRCGVGVDGFVGDDRVEGIRLADGAVVDADLVVVGVGVTPETAWLEGSGIELANGVVVDATCATAVDGIVAAGDVARWPSARYGSDVRVEHWTNAVEQGRAAAKRLLGGPGVAPYDPVPFFWSDQYDTTIQFAGHTRAGDRVEVVHGSVDDRAFVALYGGDREVTAVLGFDRPRLVNQYRRLLAGGGTWDAARELARGTRSGGTRSPSP